MKRPIRTPRLVLEPVSASDLSLLHAHWGEPAVREFLMDGEAPPVEQVLEMIEKSDRLFDTDAAGLWKVRGQDGAFVGCVGFWYFHEPPERELVVSLAPGQWRKGIATESCRAVIGHGFGELGWDRVQASTDSPNQRSLAMIQRLGMRPIGTRPGAFGTIEVFEISSEEWEGRKGGER